MKATLRCETRINSTVPSRIIECNFEGIPRNGYAIINLFNNEFKSFVVPYLRPYVNQTQGLMANLINLNNNRKDNNQEFQDFISEITNNYTVPKALNIPCTVEFLAQNMDANTSEQRINLIAENSIRKILLKYGILMEPHFNKQFYDHSERNLEYDFEWTYWINITNHPLVNTIDDCPIIMRRIKKVDGTCFVKIISKWNIVMTKNEEFQDWEPIINTNSTTTPQFIENLQQIITRNMEHLITYHRKF
jgi:hypothetical protein